MPRVALLKASTAARRRVPHQRCFDLEKQPIVIERVAARIFEIIMNCGQEAAVIHVDDDIVNPLIERAPIFKDRNGRRIQQTILQALARLAANGYIQYCPHRDDVERFRITPHFQTIIQELIDKLTATCSDTFHYNAIEHHRFNCCFFRTKFRKNFKRNATRRELDLENRRLIFQAEEHLRICPLEQVRSRSVATEATEIFDPSVIAQESAGPSRSANDHDNGDSMYVDDVPRTEPVASGSGLQPPRTPARSRTLNSVGAYPSPESLERTVSLAPLTPAPTPSRSRSVTTAGGSDDNGGLDMEVDTLGDDPPPRISGTLFNPDVPQTPRQCSHLRLEAEHEEAMATLRMECDEQLRAKGIECDARLHAQRVEFEAELTVKIAETDRSWLRKLDSLRKTSRLKIQLFKRQVKHHISRGQRQEEKMKSVKEKHEQEVQALTQKNVSLSTQLRVFHSFLSNLGLSIDFFKASNPLIQ